MSRVTQNLYILVAPVDTIAEALMMKVCEALGTEYIEPGAQVTKYNSGELFGGDKSFYCTSFERYKNIAKAYDGERRVVCFGIKVDKQRVIQELRQKLDGACWPSEYDEIPARADRMLEAVADMPVFCDAPVKFELDMQETVDHLVYLVNYYEGAALAGDSYKKGKPRQRALNRLYKAWREL